MFYYANNEQYFNFMLLYEREIAERLFFVNKLWACFLAVQNQNHNNDE